MMKRIISSFIVMIFLTIVSLSIPVKAQTPGDLVFSVKTTEPAGGYTGVHVIALWIEDTNGTFVKTKIRYAQDRIQYLDHWISSSAYNVVDATTGATLANHDSTLTFIWNGTDVTGSLVADQPYKVWIQMSDRDQSGTQYSMTFVKDSSSHHIAPADTGNFTNIVLDWNPTIGINETEKENLAFRCEPNPFSQNANIYYYLAKNADVTLRLHDAAGKMIMLLNDENQVAGEHSIALSGDKTSQLIPGIYYLEINTGSVIATKKLVLLR